jgi:hypothetical protein
MNNGQTTTPAENCIFTEGGEFGTDEIGIQNHEPEGMESNVQGVVKVGIAALVGTRK